jgi:hypothetical protein
VFEEERLREAFFYLLYRQHGGSGLNLSYTEMLSMDLGEILWFLQRLAETRDDEARALKG